MNIQYNGTRLTGAQTGNTAQLPGTRRNVRAQGNNAVAGGFAQILEQAERGAGAGLVISKHAECRLRDRNINLTAELRNKISDALDKADRKGVRDALVMAEGLAVVANARSKTVITAVTETELRQNIFTNIDGVVFT